MPQDDESSGQDLCAMRRTGAYCRHRRPNRNISPKNGKHKQFL